MNISPTMQSLDNTNVFVKYLPSSVDDGGLADLFSSCGVIRSAKVMVDHQTGLSLGFGFVRFDSPEEAYQAIHKMSGQRVQNKNLLCKLSNCSSNSITPEPSSNLYIKPLLPNTRESDLKELFGAFGPIAAAKVMVDKATGESKQIGFVRFEEVEHASAALHALNGHKLTEDSPALIVKYAESEYQRSVRKARQQPPQQYPPPASPPSPPMAYYYPNQQVSMYSTPMTYASYFQPTLPYYVTMMPYTSSYSPPTPSWVPPYLTAQEQAGAY